MGFILKLLADTKNVVIGVMFLVIVLLTAIGYSKSMTIIEQKDTITLNEKEIHNLKVANALEKANVINLNDTLDRQNLTISELNKTVAVSKLALDAWHKKASKQKYSDLSNSIFDNNKSDCTNIINTLKLLNNTTPKQLIRKD